MKSFTYRYLPCKIWRKDITKIITNGLFENSNLATTMTICSSWLVLFGVARWNKKYCICNEQYSSIVNRRNENASSILGNYTIMYKLTNDTELLGARGNPGNSGQFSARQFSTEMSKTLRTAYVKYYLLSIKETILFCFKSKLIGANLIFFLFYETIYTTCGWGKNGRMWG